METANKPSKPAIDRKTKREGKAEKMYGKEKAQKPAAVNANGHQYGAVAHLNHGGFQGLAQISATCYLKDSHLKQNTKCLKLKK